MKKYGLPLVVVLIVLGVYIYFFREKAKPVREPKKDPLGITVNSSVFTESYAKVVAAYLALKDAFVASDTALANRAALELAASADSLKIDDIKGDSTGTLRETARFYTGSVAATVQSLTAAKDLESKRKEFETLTDAVWSLTRIVKYNGGTLFYEYCPMAFNNKGAYWISDSRKIRNPYFGKKMMECGEVADTLNYSRK